MSALSDAASAPALRDRMARARSNWREIQRHARQEQALVHKMVVEAVSKGARQEDAERIAAPLAERVAARAEATRRAVFRWAYGHSATLPLWLPGSWREFEDLADQLFALIPEDKR